MTVVPFRKKPCCVCGEDATKRLECYPSEGGPISIKWFCDDCYPIIEK